MNDEEQKRKFAMLVADLIQELLRESDDLSAILELAKEEGYDIFLTIFSGIMIRDREELTEVDDIEESAPIEFEFTQFDKEFLQSIGIQVTENE